MLDAETIDNRSSPDAMETTRKLGRREHPACETKRRACLPSLPRQNKLRCSLAQFAHRAGT